MVRTASGRSSCENLPAARPLDDTVAELRRVPEPLRDPLRGLLAGQPRLPAVARDCRPAPRPTRPTRSAGRTSLTCSAVGAAATGLRRGRGRHRDRGERLGRRRSTCSPVRTTSCRPAALGGRRRYADELAGVRHAHPGRARAVPGVHGRRDAGAVRAPAATRGTWRCSRTGCARPAPPSTTCTSSSWRSTSTGRRPSGSSLGWRPSPTSTRPRSSTTPPRTAWSSRRTSTRSRSRGSGHRYPALEVYSRSHRHLPWEHTGRSCAGSPTCCTRCTPRPAPTCRPTRSGTTGRPTQQSRCRGTWCSSGGSRPSRASRAEPRST